MTVFKPFDHSDIQTMLSMMQEFYAIDNYPSDPAILTILLDQFAADPKLGKAWIIQSEEEAIGYLIVTFVFSFEYGGRIAFLDELFISAKARGKGIGKATLDFVKEQAELAGLKLVYLEIEPHNETARELYLSKGFQAHGRHLMKWKPLPNK